MTKAQSRSINAINAYRLPVFSSSVDDFLHERLSPTSPIQIKRLAQTKYVLARYYAKKVAA